MKVILINGSPRKEGNTYLALKECAGEIEKYGIETEIFHIGNQAVHGCIACNSCAKTGKCIFSDDVMPEMLAKMQEADGIIIGSPTYYAGPNGSLCALLDRAFYSGSHKMKYKPGAAVAVCRRGGASAALDRLNKYFTINEMPLVSSQYWNIVYGRVPGEVLQDAEGFQTMRVLGKNMAYMVKQLSGEKCPTLDETPQWTHFIR
ncbi:MAG: flavodoxin family protein [Anaerovoracaceae bacterium]